MGIAAHNDHYWMEKALALAEIGQQNGEVPVGAVLVLADELVGQGYNSPIADCDPTAHAEIKALRQAARVTNNYRIPESTLYVTVEPCAMCAGAVVQARVARVVFGTVEPRSGAAGSVMDVFANGALNHRPRCEGGVMAHQARELLKQFFRSRRGNE